MMWIEKIKEDYNTNKLQEDINNEYYIFSEGNHIVKIDLKTKDKVTLPSKDKDRTYIIFSTIYCDKPKLRLTPFQYGLLLKNIAKLEGFSENKIPEIVKIIANVSKDDSEKLLFDFSVIGE